MERWPLVLDLALGLVSLLNGLDVDTLEVGKVGKEVYDYETIQNPK